MRNVYVSWKTQYCIIDLLRWQDCMLQGRVRWQLLTTLDQALELGYDRNNKIMSSSEKSWKRKQTTANLEEESQIPQHFCY